MNETNVIFFRTSGGRLHLIQDVGKIPLVDATLIEEPTDSDREDDRRFFSSSKSFKCLRIITNVYFVQWIRMCSLNVLIVAR